MKPETKREPVSNPYKLHRPYPTWICFSCGTKYGNGAPKNHLPTFHQGDACDVCGKLTDTTEPRDYGHLKDGWQNERS